MRDSKNKDYYSLLESISTIASSIHEINILAVAQYTPIVEDIIHSSHHNATQIERILDHLLDFCGYEPALQLYKRLCRYYYDIDPVTTIAYVNFYREQWDSETEIPSS